MPPTYGNGNARIPLPVRRDPCGNWGARRAFARVANAASAYPKTALGLGLAATLLPSRCSITFRAVDQNVVAVPERTCKPSVENALVISNRTRRLSVTH